MKTRTSSYLLRLPVSLKAAVKKLAQEDGSSLNQFVVTAVAEKVSALRAAAYFEERGAKANRKAFRRILDRKKGEPPRPGDELPE